MKFIKRLKRIALLQLTLSKKGFTILRVLVKLISKIRFIIRRGKLKNSHSSTNNELFHAIKKLEPILTRFGDTLSNKSEFLKTTLNQVASVINEEKTVHNNKDPSIIDAEYTIIPLNAAPIAPVTQIHDREPHGEGLEQQLKNLFTEIKISRFTGTTIANQIETILDTGIQFAHQLNDSMHQKKMNIVQEETTAPAQSNWNDFIAGIDEVSLSVELLQAHVNQLMSCHEIN